MAKLGDFLRQAPRRRPVNPRPVQFSAVEPDKTKAQAIIDVDAALVFVDEDARAQIGISARASLEKRFPEAALDEEDLKNERAYQLLFLCLRDAEDPRASLAASVDELRAALVLPEARRLSDEYDRYIQDEFPPAVDDETWRQMVVDAEKNCLGDLLTKYGSAPVGRLISSLAARSGR
jgi:hypothetical protein